MPRYTIETFGPNGEPKAVWMYVWPSLEAVKAEAEATHAHEGATTTIVWDSWNSGAKQVHAIPA